MTHKSKSRETSVNCITDIRPVVPTVQKHGS